MWSQDLQTLSTNEGGVRSGVNFTKNNLSLESMIDLWKGLGSWCKGGDDGGEGTEGDGVGGRVYSCSFIMIESR